MNSADTQVEVGVSIPRGDDIGRPQLERWLDAVAGVGLDHVFAADHVSFRGGLGMDGLIQMAYVLGAHDELKACVGVYLLALRHPTAVARQLSTLSELAPGRLVFGVGVGGEDRSEMWSVGVDPASRGRRTDEYLEVVRLLATGEAVSYEGEFVNLDGVAVKPAPDPRVPIVVGGRSDAAVRRAALLSEGWLASWCSAKRFESALADVSQTAAAAGREVERWLHGMQLWVGVGDDVASAKSRVGPAMEAFYGVPFGAFERYTPAGTPADIAQFLAPYRDAGAAMFNLTPIARSTEEGVEAIGEVKRLLAQG